MALAAIAVPAAAVPSVTKLLGKFRNEEATWVVASFLQLVVVQRLQTF
jgi:hypothetical protein